MTRTAISPRLATRTLVICGMSVSLPMGFQALLDASHKKRPSTCAGLYEPTRPPSVSSRGPQLRPLDPELPHEAPQGRQRHPDDRRRVAPDPLDERAAETVDRERPRDVQGFAGGDV